MDEPLFRSDGDRFVPSEHTRGPWAPDAQHGGPAAALLTRALEALPADSDMALARLTLEILRPVPLSPLSVSAAVERPGRRVQLVGAVLRSGDVELCRARGWRVRVADRGGLPAPADGLPFAPPDNVRTRSVEPGLPAFHRTGVEVRFVRGSLEAVGPSVAWIRLLRPVVDEETPSPAMRAAAAADFGNGISAAVSWERYFFLNTDLTVYLHRLPRGEWVCLDATTHAGTTGVAVALSTLYDEVGRIGIAAQTLLVEPRPESSPAQPGFGVP